MIYCGTFEHVCLFHLFTAKIDQSWDTWWTFTWLFVVLIILMHSFANQNAATSDYLVQILIFSISNERFLSIYFCYIFTNRTNMPFFINNIYKFGNAFLKVTTCKFSWVAGFSLYCKSTVRSTRIALSKW